MVHHRSIFDATNTASQMILQGNVCYLAVPHFITEYVTSVIMASHNEGLDTLLTEVEDQFTECTFIFGRQDKFIKNLIGLLQEADIPYLFDCHTTNGTAHMEAFLMNKSNKQVNGQNHRMSARQLNLDVEFVREQVQFIQAQYVLFNLPVNDFLIARSEQP